MLVSWAASVGPSKRLHRWLWMASTNPDLFLLSRTDVFNQSWLLIRQLGFASDLRIDPRTLTSLFLGSDLSCQPRSALRRILRQCFVSAVHSFVVQPLCWRVGWCLICSEQTNCRWNSIFYLQCSSNLSTLSHSPITYHPTARVNSLIIISFSISASSLSEVLQPLLSLCQWRIRRGIRPWSHPVWL